MSLLFDGVDAEGVDADDFFADTFGFEPTQPSAEDDSDDSGTTVPDDDSEAESVDVDDDVDEDAEEDEDDEDDEDDESEDDEDEDELDEDDDEEEWLVKGRFKKGEDEKLARSYRGLESWANRTINELKEQLDAEREAAREEMRNLVAQVQQTAARPVEPQIDPFMQQHRMAQIAEYALTDGYGAYGAAVQAGDDLLVQRVIGVVAAGDPENGIAGNPLMAEELRSDYFNRRLQEQAITLQQATQKAQGEAGMKSALSKFRTDYPDHLELKDEMGEWMKPRLKRIDAGNEDDVYALLVDAYDAVLGRKAREGKREEPVTKKRKRAEKVKATVESGTHRAPTKRRKPKQDVAAEAASAFADDLVSLSQATRYV